MRAVAGFGDALDRSQKELREMSPVTAESGAGGSHEPPHRETIVRSRTRRCKTRRL